MHKDFLLRILQSGMQSVFQEIWIPANHMHQHLTGSALNYKQLSPHSAELQECKQDNSKNILMRIYNLNEIKFT